MWMCVSKFVLEWPRAGLCIVWTFGPNVIPQRRVLYLNCYVQGNEESSVCF